MANIRVDLDYTLQDGAEIKFRSPVDCSQVAGLIVYYPGIDGNITSKEFVFADAHGNNVGDIDHLFAEDVVVKVILDVTKGMAFVQNADTNAYIEDTFLKKTGGTMTGAIAMGGKKITGLGTPTANTDAATKEYADKMLPLAGGEVIGDLVVHKIDILPKSSAYIPGLKILDIDSNSRGGIYSGTDHKMYLSNFSKGTDKAERFYLPAPESGLTDTASYDILTTKTHGIDLLWTNASPTSNFPAQTLSLGLNAYSMYIILARAFRDASSAVCAIGRTGYGVRLNTIGGVSDGYHEVRRAVDYISGGSLKFYDVFRNGVTNSDGYLVPQFIYGVKGVRQL